MLCILAMTGWWYENVPEEGRSTFVSQSNFNPGLQEKEDPSQDFSPSV